MDYFELAKSITRNHVRKIMQTPEQELESRANPEAPLCRNCDHDAHAEWCDVPLPIYRQIDDWKDTCGCTNYEPADLESTLQDEGKI